MTEKRPRGRMPDPSVRLARLDLGDLPARGEFVVGMAPLAGHVVVVSMTTQDLSTEQRIARIKPMRYVVTHLFATDFTECRTRVLSIGEHDNAKPDYAKLIQDGDGLLLNTFFERPSFLGDPQSVLAKRVAITSDGAVLIGDAPLPPLIEWVHSRSYPWDGNVLRMASDFVMECVEPNGNQHWRRRISAHLYMPIEFREGRAYFGTAGNGGRFHCIDPVTGVDHYSINTGGTELYNWWGNDRIVLTDRRKPAVVVIDAHSGAELVRVGLGRYEVYESAPRILSGGLFFTRAFAPDRSQHIVRVDLDAALGNKTGDC